MKYPHFLSSLSRRLGFIFFALLIATSSVFLIPPIKSHAAGPTLQTGYYIGNGANGHTISGLGFHPDLVMIKVATSATFMAFKTSAMPAADTAIMESTDDTNTQVILNSDGFTVQGSLTSVNAAGQIFYWIAIGGSDCSSTGAFCVGSYTGNSTGGTTPRTVTTNFQPNLVMVKTSGGMAGNFHTASMPVNQAEYFDTSTTDTTGGLVSSFTSTGFNIGSADNVYGSVYYYIAIKSTANFFNEGTYTGDGTDNRNITGVGFQTDAVFIKNTSSATAANHRPIFSITQNYGDDANYIGDSMATNTNMIQQLSSDGFQVGSSPNSNESGSTFYWFAFGGAPPPAAGSGTFTMQQGTYTGTGAAQTISTTFKPDLVIVKGDGANYAVFRLSIMGGDSTLSLGQPISAFTGGITAISATGFTVGTNASTNTSGTVYYWEAFGNAFNPETNTGASDFEMGAYNGDSIASRQISENGTAFAFAAVKQLNGGTSTVYRDSDMSGNVSGTFGSGGETSGIIQSMDSTGLNLGTAGSVNSNNSIYVWFGFKAGTNFASGTYTGTGVNGQAVTLGSGLSPNFVMVKRTTSSGVALMQPSTLSGLTQYVLNTADASGEIESLTSTGMTVGTTANVGASTGTYRYLAWKVPATGSLGADIVDGSGNSVSAPSIAMAPITYPFSCTPTTGTLGSSTQKVRLSNSTTDPTWTLAIAATGGTNALWETAGNTSSYDYNDESGSPAGCSDGPDSDTVAGQLSLDPSAATITPSTGCTTTGLSLAPATAFSSTTSNITLLSSSTGAQTNCYWDVTNIKLKQYIPANQPSGSYSMNMTLTATAS